MWLDGSSSSSSYGVRGAAALAAHDMHAAVQQQPKNHASTATMIFHSVCRARMLVAAAVLQQHVTAQLSCSKSTNSTSSSSGCASRSLATKLQLELPPLPQTAACCFISMNS